MAIIDFHCHILPGIDDGSRNPDISKGMIGMAKEQKIEIMVATPHFYADKNRIEVFLEKRKQAWERIHTENEKMKFRIGAEVAYFDGISKAKDIDKLTIEGTNTLLLEMPFSPWTAKVMDEAYELQEKRGFTVVLAHLERFLSIKGNKPFVKELLDSDLKVQVNGEGFNDFFMKRTLLSWIRDGKVDALGSDSHGIHRRIQNLGPAREIIKAKLGESALHAIDQKAMNLLGTH